MLSANLVVFFVSTKKIECHSGNFKLFKIMVDFRLYYENYFGLVVYWVSRVYSLRIASY